MTKTRVVIVCGTGGVGKTTVASGLALAEALAGRRVVVLTIDPARRLADALGLEFLGNNPTPVRIAPVEAAGGSLHALMLDRKAQWDKTIRSLAPNHETAEKLLANRYYQAVSTRLTGSHEYMATEKLFELVHEGAWDMVIVDTPPSQHALEFLQAPERVLRLFDRGIMNALTGSRGGLVGSATKRMVNALSQILGDGVLEEMTEFFRLVSGLSTALREHSATVDALLRGPSTQYYLVTSPASRARQGALDFLEVLRTDERYFAGFVANRVVSSPELAAERVSLPDAAPTDWSEALDGIYREAEHIRAVARRHEQSLAALAAQSKNAAIWTVPLLDDTSSTETLLKVARHLPPLRERPSSRS